jgi:exodeoxyribonuclease VII small subunit
MILAPKSIAGNMSKTGKPTPPKDFESALAEMERLVTGMESGEMSLETSLAAYKRGMELSAYCQQVLADAEMQVQILENGQLKDFDPTSVDTASDD